jgi:hypothetical protein
MKSYKCISCPAINQSFYPITNCIHCGGKLKEITMDDNLSKSDKDRGFTSPDWDKERNLDDTPTNSQWRDLDDGGFLGRPKGNER